MITISLDVTLIDKARLKEVTRRDGKKAKFCELILIETPNSEYGDYMVKESDTKEERAVPPAQRKQRPILGNAKIVGTRRTAAPENSEPEAEQPDADDVPF